MTSLEFMEVPTRESTPNSARSAELRDARSRFRSRKLLTLYVRLHAIDPLEPTTKYARVSRDSRQRRRHSICRRANRVNHRVKGDRCVSTSFQSSRGLDGNPATGVDVEI